MYLYREKMGFDEDYVMECDLYDDKSGTTVKVMLK